MKYLIYLFLLLPLFSIGQVYNIRSTASSGISPTLAATPNTLTCTSVINFQGIAQSYLLTGSNLGINNVVVTAPSGYVVSLDNSAFAGLVTVIPSAGNVNIVIWVALASSNSIPGSKNGAVTNVVSGVPTVNVTCTGTVAGPSISASPNVITNLNSVIGSAGIAQSSIITFANLTSNIIVTTFSPVEISLDNITFSGSTITISTASPKTIYMRESASAPAGAVGGSINLIATGASTSITVSGTVSSIIVHDSAMFNTSLGTISGGTGWTNLSGDPGSAGSIRTTSVTNGTTTFGINTVATTNWTAFGGANAFANNGINVAGFFPAAVTFQNYYQAYNGVPHDSTHAQFALTGLNIAKLYTISVSGSNQFTNPSTSDYYVSGALSPSTYGFQVLANFNNSANGVTFLHVQPDGTGKILFFFQPNAGVGSNIGQVNGIKIVTE